MIGNLFEAIAADHRTPRQKKVDQITACAVVIFFIVLIGGIVFLLIEHDEETRKVKDLQDRKYLAYITKAGCIRTGFVTDGRNAVGVYKCSNGQVYLATELYMMANPKQ